MNKLEKIVLPALFLIGATISSAKGQDGTVVNYNTGNPVSGIEVYLDSILVDTTNAQGGFGIPVSIVRDDSPIIPKEYKLNLYPNPFNPSTTFEYSIPYQADVSVRVMNSLGQKLYGEDYKNQQTGTYLLLFEADNRYASQVLFFELYVKPKDSAKPEFRKVHKGVLLK